MRNYSYLGRDKEAEKSIDYLFHDSKYFSVFQAIIYSSPRFQLSDYQIRIALEHPHAICQAALASLVSQNFKHEHIERLLDHNLQKVRSIAISNPSIPLTEKQVDKIIGRDYWFDKALIVNRRDVELTEEQLIKCLFDDSYQVRLAAVKRPEVRRLSRHIISAVLNAADGENRLIAVALVKNINLNEPMIYSSVPFAQTYPSMANAEQALTDEYLPIRILGIIDNSVELTDFQIKRALFDSDVWVRSVMAMKSNTLFSTENINIILKGNDYLPIYFLANNRSVTFNKEQIDTLLGFDEPAITGSIIIRDDVTLTEKQFDGLTSDGNGLYREKITNMKLTEERYKPRHRI